MRQGDIVMIAPLFILKHDYLFFNKKGVYLLGRTGWSDYLNLVYSSFDKDAFDFLLSKIKDKYNVKVFFFEQLPVTSALFEYVIKKKSTIMGVQKCVALELPETEEEYMKTLSKNSRQNLRTAQNRLTKDELNLDFVFDDKILDRHECEILRESRLGKKNYEPNLWKRFYHFMGRKIKIRFKWYLPFYEDKESKIMTAYENGQLKAFFNYGWDYAHKTIVVMAAGTDEKFARYSPGMLLMFAFIKERIKAKDLNVLDFTRGNEKYKHALGGREHLLYHIKMRF